MMTAEERLAWWHEVRFGMFIHWGLYASLAGEWKGEKIPGIGEWIMRNAKIPIEEYEKLAKDFNPVKFNADEWAELARQAGMKYLVITAKHHDGFCMFDSPSNPYNIVAQTPFKRDPMKELADACNQRGIKMCFYYSQALDWHAPGGAGHWDEVGDGEEWLSYARPAGDFQKYLEEVVKPNLRELLTHYGPIGLIWFDTPVAITPEQSAELRDFVHSLQPACLVSGRVGHDVGDYGSLGDNQHPDGKVDGAWETPATLNDTWGYKHDDHNWKSLEYLLDLLVNCASKGVNYLLNVGPTAEGVIPQPSVDLLKQVGAWLERNGEAIYGTVASPFPLDPAWGKITTKGNTLYLLIKAWPADGQIRLVGLRNAVRSMRVLGCPAAEVSVTRDGDVLSLAVPSSAPEAIVSVIAVELDGAPDVEDMIIQDGASEVLLPMNVAEREGDYTLNPAGYTEGWKAAGGAAKWKFRLKAPGEYDVMAVTFCRKAIPQQYGNHALGVSVAGQRVAGQAGAKDLDLRAEAPGPQKVRSLLGRVRLEKAGEYDIAVVAERIDPTSTKGVALLGVALLVHEGGEI